jgi:hypothetical protein
MSPKIFSSLEDEIKSSLLEEEPFEKLEVDISQSMKIRRINENKSKRRMKTFSLYNTHMSFIHSRFQPTLHQNLPFWADFQLDQFTYTINMSLKQHL